jgi:hypothetical protein
MDVTEILYIALQYKEGSNGHVEYKDPSYSEIKIYRVEPPLSSRRPVATPTPTPTPRGTPTPTPPKSPEISGGAVPPPSGGKDKAIPSINVYLNEDQTIRSPLSTLFEISVAVFAYMFGG